MARLYIGIDCGTHTGVAVWHSGDRKFIAVETMMIHQALEYVKELKRENEVKVYFEDARLRTWYGDNDPKKDRDKLQGAGSVKRDSAIWEDFLLDNSIPFVAVKPAKGNTKWRADWFKRVTGWKGRTSEHSRDAAVLVYGR